MLEQDAVYIGIIIQAVDFRDQLFGTTVFIQHPSNRLHADALAGIAFHFYVGRRGRVVAHQNRCQYRCGSLCMLFDLCDAFTQLQFDFGGKGFSVQNNGRHGFS